MIEKCFTLMFGMYLYIAIAAMIILTGLSIAEIVISAIESFRWHRKTSLLEKKGYERYLHSWKKEGHNRILESDMDRMTFKDLKRRVNENE